jgi:tRNA threonylcarbamoyladenosine biosynthesis protein TsaE
MQPTRDDVDQAGLENMARRMAACLGPWMSKPGQPLSLFITLDGDLGAGKTTFARALLRALGVEGPIKSPTFALLESYEVQGLCVSHLDLYRMRDAQEWESSGLRDTLLEPGLKLMEWSDRAGNLVPLVDLGIELQVQQEATRRVVMRAGSERGVLLQDAAFASNG